MNPALFQQPFFSVELPIIVTLIVAAWNQNRRFDDMSKRIDDLTANVNRRLDEIIQRLARIEAKLENHEDRITRMEERSFPIKGIR